MIKWFRIRTYFLTLKNNIQVRMYSETIIGQNINENNLTVKTNIDTNNFSNKTQDP